MAKKRKRVKTPIAKRNPVEAIQQTPVKRKRQSQRPPGRPRKPDDERKNVKIGIMTYSVLRPLLESIAKENRWSVSSVAELLMRRGLAAEMRQRGYSESEIEKWMALP